MKRKISVRIFIIGWLFLIFTAGCCVLCYKVLFPFYYDWGKDRQIREAYMDIGDLDLANLEEKDYSVFAGYENEDLSFTIADEEMNAIYTSKENQDYLVYKNIEMKQELFSKEPKIMRRNTKLRESTKLRGILTQDDINFYVVIKDVSPRIEIEKTTEQFLLMIVVPILLLSSLLMWKFTSKLSKPIEQLVLVTDKIVQGNFAEQAKEEGVFLEASQLAENINYMAKKLQKNFEQIDESRQQQIRQSVQQERIEKMRKDFIANISHELKTPLTVISSQTEMIAYVGEEDKQYYLLSIQEEIEKMSNMVSELLDISVMEHHLEGMFQKVLDMKEIMEYILMKYHGLIQKKKLHMEVFLEELCFVYGDREYMEQAVNNYMMNAFEHTEIGGSIRVTLKKQKKNIRLGVYNTGKQIPPEELEHIWNGYYTTKLEENSVFSNAGLGLYIVQSVITMQNGKYGVENLPEGVEFWFTLPEVTSKLEN